MKIIERLEKAAASNKKVTIVHALNNGETRKRKEAEILKITDKWVDVKTPEKTRRVPFDKISKLTVHRG